MLDLRTMSTYTSSITSITGVPASVRDKLLTVNGGYSIADDVKMDSDYLFDCYMNDIDFTMEERQFLSDIIDEYPETETFMFCP